MHHVTKNNMKV